MFTPFSSRGNNGAREPKASNPIADLVGDVASQPSFPSAYKDFTHPGSDPKELLMRTWFPDANTAKAAVLMMHKIGRFNMDKKYESLIMMLLAANTSIDGLARKELLQAVTNVIAPSLYDKHYGRDEKFFKKTKKSRNKYDDEEED